MIYLLLLFSGVYSTTTNSTKKYSIRYGAVSQIILPIDNVFHLEIQRKQSFKNTTEPELRYADFCESKNPAIFLELKQKQSICDNECKFIQADGRIYSLSSDGYLRILSLNSEDLSVSFMSEILFNFTSFENTILTRNLLHPNTILIKEDQNISVFEFEFRDANFNKNVYSHSINTTLQGVIFNGDYLYLYQKGYMEIYRLSQILVEKVGNIDLNREIAEKLRKYNITPIEILDIYLLPNNELLCYTHNLIFRVELNNLKIKTIQMIHIPGLINRLDHWNQFVYVIQQLGPKLSSQQFLLEYDGELLRQNLTLSTQVRQLLPTANFILVLQDNLLQIAFSQINTKQLFSKNILEDSTQLIHYYNNKLLVQQTNLLSSYTILQQQAQLVCEPNENYTTGQYQLELLVGYFQNGSESKSELIQHVELYVYQEIFENGNVGLYVGLTVGLIITFISMLILCVIFYKLKAKYEQDPQHQINEI